MECELRDPGTRILNHETPVGLDQKSIFWVRISTAKLQVNNVDKQPTGEFAITIFLLFNKNVNASQPDFC